MSANIIALPGDTLLYPPYRVVRRQGVRIGITGFTTPAAMFWDRRQLAGRARVGPIGPAAGPIFGAMRRDADLVVALVHSGLEGRASYDTAGLGGEQVAASLAGLSARPDVVVVGHSHREMRDSVIQGVHFVQPRPYGASVSVVHVDLVRDDGPWKVRRIRADLVSTAGVPASPLLQRRLAAARDSVREWVGTPLGLALGPMRAAAARAPAGRDPGLPQPGPAPPERRRALRRLGAGPAGGVRGHDPGP